MHEKYTFIFLNKIVKKKSVTGPLRDLEGVVGGVEVCPSGDLIQSVKHRAGTVSYRFS